MLLIFMYILTEMIRRLNHCCSDCRKVKGVTRDGTNARPIQIIADIRRDFLLEKNRKDTCGKSKRSSRFSIFALSASSMKLEFPWSRDNSKCN